MPLRRWADYYRHNTIANTGKRDKARSWCYGIFCEARKQVLVRTRRFRCPDWRIVRRPGAFEQKLLARVAGMFLRWLFESSQARFDLFALARPSVPAFVAAPLSLIDSVDSRSRALDMRD